VDHVVDISQLQYVVGKYVDKYNLLVAAGPVTAASLAKLVTRNKLVNIGIAGGGVWFAVKELSGPMLQLISDQFGYLDSLFASFR
jgi:hypothetical protein